MQVRSHARSLRIHVINMSLGAGGDDPALCQELAAAAAEGITAVVSQLCHLVLAGAAPATAAPACHEAPRCMQ